MGFVFLLALSYGIKSLPAATANSAPVAFIIRNVLGGVVAKIFLVFVSISIFACGLVIMVTNSRLIFSMARDRRLPGHQLWSKVPRATGGPSWATALAGAIGIGIVVVLRNNSNALVQLFTASTIMPALLYAATIILFITTSHRIETEEGHFNLGKWQNPVVALSLLWLAFELVILIGPAEFRTAQYYVLGSLVLGLVVFVGQMMLEPKSLQKSVESGH